jgi:acetylornithine deacetylase
VAQGAALKLEIEDLGRYPALPPPQDIALANLMERLTHRTARPAVSYGTEAGLFAQAGVAALICGPGSIARAHRPDEYIESAELSACCTVLRALAQHL